MLKTIICALFLIVILSTPSCAQTSGQISKLIYSAKDLNTDALVISKNGKFLVEYYKSQNAKGLIDLA